MLKQSLFLAIGLLSSIISAQSSIIPSSQPACIQQCTLFTQAQQACVPTQGNSAQYQSCFCQSAYLATIKTAPTNNICPNCAAADWTTITSWFNGLCNGGTNAGAAAGGQTTLTTQTTTPAGNPTTSTTRGATSGTNQAVSHSSDTNDPANWTDGQSWFRTHWQWVVMIIVLAVAFTVIGVVGSIIYKRKSRSKEIGRNNTAPMTSNPAVNSWAPSRHSVHDFGTPRDASPAGAAPPVVNARRESRRLGKSPIGRG